MSHPTDRLADYALGELTPEEARMLEIHLGTCETCRAELRRLNDTLVQLTERLPEAEPAEVSWQAVAARLPSSRSAPRRPAWQPFALAASLLLGLAGLWWGVNEGREAANLRAEQAVVTRWLAQSDVHTLALPEVGGESFGSLLMLPDGRALVVLREAPPAGSSYQAWGHRDGEVAPMAVSSDKVFEVNYSGFEAVGVSLEPEGGSQQPTQPLGKTSLL